MSKYQRLHERLLPLAPVLGISLHEPAAASDEDLLRAHAPDYVARMSRGEVAASEMRRIGFPWSAAMVERSRRSSGATMQALAGAIRGDAVGVNLAGGTHHAYADRGGGYCVFNDSVVAARHVQAQGLAQRVLIVDLDVHQGNGTAALCANDDRLFAFSMHAGRNYPAVKECGDLDVALPDGCGDVQYLDALAAHLPQAIARARPDAVIYVAGADPYAGDRLGLLSLSKPGLAARDRMVFDACARHDLPVAVSMAGGYAEDVEDIVDIHLETIRQAARAAACRAVVPPE